MWQCLKSLPSAFPSTRQSYFRCIFQQDIPTADQVIGGREVSFLFLSIRSQLGCLSKFWYSYFCPWLADPWKAEITESRIEFPVVLSRRPQYTLGGFLEDPEFYPLFFSHRDNCFSFLKRFSRVSQTFWPGMLESSPPYGNFLIDFLQRACRTW